MLEAFGFACLLLFVGASSFSLISSSHLKFGSKLLMSSTSTENLSIPPTTFLNCVKQSVKAVKAALANNETLLEVEFPPLPLEVLQDSSSSARDIADANTRWAIEFAQGFTEDGLNVSIIYPDQAELEDAIKYVDMGDTINPFPKITLATIRTDRYIM